MLNTQEAYAGSQSSEYESKEFLQNLKKSFIAKFCQGNETKTDSDSRRQGLEQNHKHLSGCRNGLFCC